MIAQSLTVPNAEDLYARLWHRGDGTERGVVILVHGLGDHGGRFASFARRMLRRRWAVFAFDLPGHGRSPGRRGTVKSYDSLLQLIASSRQLLWESFGVKHQVVIGHSMGGNVAVNYALRRAEFDAVETPDLSGLVLVAPMLMPPSFLDRPKIFAAWGTGQLFRWIRLSKPARVEQLTRDGAAAERFRTDPLQHSQISLYLATQLLAQGRFALDHAAAIETPTLIVQGDEDELIDHAACRNLALRMRERAEFVRWPGGRHDLIQDIDAEDVADHLAGWMSRKVNQFSPALRLARQVDLNSETLEGLLTDTPTIDGTWPTTGRPATPTRRVCQ
ncbi:lysophospholipase [Stieleria sp. ICT_E10.1]|uniref:alpha/beta hydrolase n=1 Tax=Stieleria sedimenti TaxID=2976331 RepID=UPI00217FC4B8|nr:alpha/beta hydrolase [Stieleria sedimenti]MCS7465523.1 lysophospholipase [Stieleria sedimenti]